MNDIPIFDCLTHPSLEGNWIDSRWTAKNSFEQLEREMRAANVRWCLAVTMGSTGGYDLLQYPKACLARTGQLFPIAFFSIAECHTGHQVELQLTRIRDLGYLGIKIHPRLSGVDFGHPLLPTAIRIANRFGLAVLLCTYFYSSNSACGKCSPETLRELLHQVPSEKMILVHGGGLRLLEVSEMTRPFKHVLLDVSFTLCEYAGSSVDLDLRYVFERCCGRVCLGSDSPEISLTRMRERFEQLTQGVEEPLRERIAYKNLFAFMGMAS